MRWQDRAHFLAMAARLMRRILVDNARAKGYEARRRRDRVSRSTTRWSSATRERRPRALDDALRQFAAVSDAKAQVVELRFFGGLSVEETAEALHVSPETVKRDCDGEGLARSAAGRAAELKIAGADVFGRAS